jgi:hypothetical protein
MRDKEKRGRGKRKMNLREWVMFSLETNDHKQSVQMLDLNLTSIIEAK